MRYIDADDALERLDMICNDCPSRAYCEDRKSKCRVYSGTEEFLINASTIEAEPVKHGRWISQGDDMWLCSNCKKNIIYSMHKSDRTEKQRYCCRCGARMGGDSE